ncbi:PLDc N-terminal domain-containing protein [Halobellus limi]|jgi:glucose uptake protein GlcU|uniref:Phospholipase_D-nuclease N-terminal n=2 Tax=Halobellus limi TaxID=699433 RepID=A0A1H6BTQ8_9EURY|nr:Phospholipase_D-nuclease N-terminal [Halobellus limi]
MIIRMPSPVLLQSAAAGLFVFFGLLLLIVGVVLVVWTYRDAQQNSSQSASLWAIVVFLAPLLGFVLYLLLGRDKR